LWLVGNIGAAFWPHFERWRARQRDRLNDPLDAWSRMIIGEVAEESGAIAVLPNDRPYLPFQQWAMRAEALRPSPLGILMHPRFGLWHAYRGALLFDVSLQIDVISEVRHCCDSCAEKPCLKACPVNAHQAEGFRYQDCLDHVRGESGHACRSTGCLDRNACPIGVAYRYPVATQEFFMNAFSR
jgi:hypothetical protein